MKKTKKMVEKKAKILASRIERHYECHNVKVRLRFYVYLIESQRFIFQITPVPGTRKKDIFDRAEDIQVALPTPRPPLFLPFSKGTQILLAVSMVSNSKISLWRMLTSTAFRSSDKTLPVALGCSLMGEMVIEDLSKMIHAMYVGATGSGKSIGLMCMILSLICLQPVSKVSLIIFDVGADTLDLFEGIPHLAYPIVKDRDEGVYVIQSLAAEMERRYSLEEYQRRDLPTIVCVFDEFISYIDSFDNKQQRQMVVNIISDILRRGRKAKISLVLATQEPRSQKMAVDIGNITSRMAFKVARFQTSSAILNHGGAEKLPGDGAMLYQSAKYPEGIYVQGAYISNDEAAQLVERVKAAEQDLSCKFVIPEVAVSDFPASLSISEDTVQTGNREEQEFASIILWTLARKEIAASQLKRDFRMGNRANTIIDKLCEVGLISEKFANQPRKVIPQSVEDIPEEVMNFLKRQGKSIDDVTAAISKRNPDSAAEHRNEHGHDTNC